MRRGLLTFPWKERKRRESKRERELTLVLSIEGMLFSANLVSVQLLLPWNLSFTLVSSRVYSFKTFPPSTSNLCFPSLSCWDGLSSTRACCCWPRHIDTEAEEVRFRNYVAPLAALATPLPSSRDEQNELSSMGTDMANTSMDSTPVQTPTQDDR